MRFISFDDNEAGVLAFGGAPVGIIAIGGMPVGVIAVGFAAAGGVSLSCGGGAGLVMITCGAGVGGFAGGVGLGIGLRTAFVGLGLDVLAKRTDVVESAPEPSRFDLRVQDDSVAIERLQSGELSEGWVLLEATRARAEPWSLVAAGAPVELAGRAVRAELEKVTDDDRRVLAHLVAEQRPDESAGQVAYRAAQPTKLVLRCDKLLASGKEPGPTTEREVERTDWVGALWKAPLLAAASAFAIWLVHDRIVDLELDRTGEAMFAAHVVRASGNAPVVGQECSVRAWLRTDGAARRKAAAEVTCGGRVIYPRKTDRLAGFDEVRAPDGGWTFRYRLALTDEGSRPDDDSSGSPSLVLDTTKHEAIVESWDDPEYRVVLTVDELSAARDAPPLLVGNEAR